MVRLGDVCEINPESSDPKKIFGYSEFVYIDISSIENKTGKVNFSNVITIKDCPSRARRVVRNNDVLISTVRPNLKAFAILKNIPEKCIASTGFAVLRVKDLILPDYLYFVTLSDFIMEQIIGHL